MENGKLDTTEILACMEDVRKQIDKLAKAIDGRFERMKKIISDYLSLGSDFAKGSLITALKQV